METKYPDLPPSASLCELRIHNTIPSTFFGSISTTTPSKEPKKMGGSSPAILPDKTIPQWIF